MSQHTFKPGDVVKFNAFATGPELKVIGEHPYHRGMVICQPIATSGVNLPYRPENLTLVRAAGEKA